MSKSIKLLLIGLIIGYTSIFTLVYSIKIGILQFTIGFFVMMYSIWYLTTKE